MNLGMLAAGFCGRAGCRRLGLALVPAIVATAPALAQNWNLCLEDEYRQFSIDIAPGTNTAVWEMRSPDSGSRNRGTAIVHEIGNAYHCEFRDTFGFLGSAVLFPDGTGTIRRPNLEILMEDRTPDDGCTPDPSRLKVGSPEEIWQGSVREFAVAGGGPIALLGNDALLGQERQTLIRFADRWEQQQVATDITDGFGLAIDATGDYLGYIDGKNVKVYEVDANGSSGPFTIASPFSFEWMTLHAPEPGGQFAVQALTLDANGSLGRWRSAVPSNGFQFRDRIPGVWGSALTGHGHPVCDRSVCVLQNYSTDQLTLIVDAFGESPTLMPFGSPGRLGRADQNAVLKSKLAVAADGGRAVIAAANMTTSRFDLHSVEYTEPPATPELFDGGPFSVPPGSTFYLNGPAATLFGPDTLLGTLGGNESGQQLDLSLFGPHRENFQFDASSFFNTGNLNHELKFGVGYREALQVSRWGGEGHGFFSSGASPGGESKVGASHVGQAGDHPALLALPIQIVPSPPAGPWHTDPRLPGHEVKVRITAGASSIAGKLERTCIPETLCFSGAVPGRPEVFVRVVGPKPNGYLWPTYVKFTTSQVEIWNHQRATGTTTYHVLPAVGQGDVRLTLAGLADKKAFRPPLGGLGAAAHAGATIDDESPQQGAAERSDLAGSPAPPLAALAAEAGDPAPPAGPWLETAALPAFRFKVRIGTGNSAKETACIAETLCVSGAISGRSEVFVRVVGPKPNGYLWPTLVKFSTSRVEAWIEQKKTGEVRYYDLAAVAAGEELLTLDGLADKLGFQP